METKGEREEKLTIVACQKLIHPESSVWKVDNPNPNPYPDLTLVHSRQSLNSSLTVSNVDTRHQYTSAHCRHQTPVYFSSLKTQDTSVLQLIVDTSVLQLIVDTRHQCTSAHCRHKTPVNFGSL